MNVNEEHEKMERLLKKFRMDFSQVTVLCDEVEQQLYQETLASNLESLDFPHLKRNF